MLNSKFLDIFNVLKSCSIMKSHSEIKTHQLILQQKYKQLIEQAYNFRQTDSALSDFSEYKAIKLLNKLNRLKYLNRETLLTTSN